MKTLFNISQFVGGLLIGVFFFFFPSCVVTSHYVLETFKFSMEHQVPLVGFSADKCVTLFAHTWIDKLHEVYYEPQVCMHPSSCFLSKITQPNHLFYSILGFVDFLCNSCTLLSVFHVIINFAVGVSIHSICEV